MTISTTTSRIAYTGDGSTVAFTIPFYFQANADIVVYVNGVLQTLGTNYTLTGATLSAGGTCTFVAAPASTNAVIIYRDPQMTQTTSYNNNDPFPAKSHELALDKALTIDQRTRDIASRAIHIPDSETSSTVTTLAVAATRANKLLAFDSNGALSYAVGPTYVGNTATGVALVDSKATAQVTTFANSVNVIRTFGGAAVGDGADATYKRGTSGSPSPFQSADGAYWTIATTVDTTQTTNIATNTAAITALNAVTYVNSINGKTGAKSISVVMQTFTSSGTYTPTSGMIYCQAFAVGSGGGGGGTPVTSGTQCSAGGGGGAGGYSTGVFSAATIGVSQTVTVGAAGTSGSGVAGGNGGNVTFGALLTANGGTGGPLGINSTTATVAGGASGGTASGGTVNSAGQTGYDGWAFISGSVVLAQGGAGGSSMLGGGGTPAMIPSGGFISGVNGVGIGSGGSGGSAGQSAGQSTGGTGTKGICYVVEYVVA